MVILFCVFIFCLLFGIFLILCGNGTMLNTTMGSVFVIISIMMLVSHFLGTDIEEEERAIEKDRVEEEKAIEEGIEESKEIILKDIKNILGDEAEFFDGGIIMYDYKVRFNNSIYDVELDNEKEIEYILFNNKIIYEKE